MIIFWTLIWTSIYSTYNFDFWKNSYSRRQLLACGRNSVLVKKILFFLLAIVSFMLFMKIFTSGSLKQQIQKSGKVSSDLTLSEANWTLYWLITSLFQLEWNNL